MFSFGQRLRGLEQLSDPGEAILVHIGKGGNLKSILASFWK